MLNSKLNWHSIHEGDITPDNINEVMSTLGIEYDQQ